MAKRSLAKKLAGALFSAAIFAALAPMTAFAADNECAVESCSGTYSNGFCTLCDAYEEPQLQNGFYQIANAGNLYWFSHKAETSPSIKATLTADINLNPGYTFAPDGTVTKNGASVNSGWRTWEPIGIASIYQGFTGAFDGNGHTISGMYCIAETSNGTNESDYLGLFSCIAGGRVEEVGVVNGYVHGSSDLGGIAGYVSSGTITKCWNEATVESTSSTAGSRFGGIAGGNNSGIIENCWNGGTINARGYNLGGIVGGQGSGTGAKLESCYNIGSVTPKNDETAYGPIAGADAEGRVLDCCYLGDAETDGLDGTTAVSEEGFRSGKATYLLNQGITDGTQMWYQTCGVGYPAYSGQTVYATASSCHVGDEATYTNIPAELPSHSYDQNGFCQNKRSDGITVCDAYQPCNKNNDGAYEIGNAGQLYWLAEQVNDAEDLSANAVLTSDINMNPGYTFALDGTVKKGDSVVTSGWRSWEPIGNYDVTGKKYSGSFDGMGHTIKGLHCNQGNGAGAGLFGRSSNASLNNITVANSAFYADQLAAAIVGDAANSSVINCHSIDNRIIVAIYTAGGVIGGCENSTVDRCSNTSEVGHQNNGNADHGHRAGGIVGWAINSTITDSWNSGTIYARKQAAGGIVGGKSDSLTIENCHNVGTISLIRQEQTSYSPILGMDYNTGVSPVIKNCYYLEASYPDIGASKRDGTTEKNASAFASGEVAWLLNGETAENTLWRQTISDSPYPSFTGGVVYCRDGAYYNESVAEAIVTVAEGSIYNGAPQEPSVSVVFNGLTLTEGTDYTASYSDNVNAGTARVTVSGKNDYVGSVSKEFTIAKASYDMSSAKWNYSEAFIYDGSEHKVEILGLPTGVAVAEYAGNAAVEPGDYTATAVFEYDAGNYNEPKMDSLLWSIKGTGGPAGGDKEHTKKNDEVALASTGDKSPSVPFALMATFSILTALIARRQMNRME